jgi:hypothetical protein
MSRHHCGVSQGTNVTFIIPAVGLLSAPKCSQAKVMPTWAHNLVGWVWEEWWGEWERGKGRSGGRATQLWSYVLILTRCCHVLFEGEKCSATGSIAGAVSTSICNEHFLRSALFWDITRHRVVSNYRRFGTTYRSHLQGSRVRGEKKSGTVT